MTLPVTANTNCGDHKKEWFFAQVSCIALFTIASYCFLTLGILPPKLRFTICDVGQGDAILVQYDALSILIDSGPNSEILPCLQAKVSWFQSHIDVLILSHLDADHVGGVESVLSRYRIRDVWWNGEVGADLQRREVLTLLEKKGATLTVPPLGAALVAPGFIASVVWNAETAVRFSSGDWKENSNSQSLGMYIMGNSFGFLSLGDLECAQELAVANMTLLNMVPFLKVSHHGSKSSSCPEFLEKLQTEVAFISVGEKNSYQHPGEQVLDELRTRRVTTLRTDQWGTLTWTRLDNRWVWASTR